LLKKNGLKFLYAFIKLNRLKSLHEILLKWHETNEDGVLACSALKEKYRFLLNTGKDYQNPDDTNVPIVNLNITFILINYAKSFLIDRLRNRVGHAIIKESTFLDSQFAALELPKKISSIWSDQECYLCIEEFELGCDKNAEKIRKYSHKIFILNFNQAVTINDSFNKIKSLIFD
jgi:gluconate kinase